MTYESLIWVVPAIILGAGLRWPRAGLLVFAAALPLFGAPPGGPYLGALDVSALAAIVTGLRAGSGKRSPIDGGVLAVVAVTTAAFLPLAYRPPAWDLTTLVHLFSSLPEVERWTILYTWRAMANLFLGVGLYFAVKRAFPDRSALLLGRALGVGIVSSLVLGFLELAGWIDLWSYRPIGLALFDDRFHSVFFHSAWMAEFVILALPLAAVAWIRWRPGWRVGGLAMVVLAMVAILFSGQRGAWLTVLVQLSIVAVIARRGWLFTLKRAAVVAAAIVAALVLIFCIVVARPEVGASVRERLADVAGNLSNRTVIWGIAGEMAVERPLLGWGAGSFSPVFDLETEAAGSSRIPGRMVLGHHHNWLTAHNTYLMILAERGGLGLAALLLLGWLVVTGAWRASASRDGDTRGLAAAILVCAGGFAAYGMVQYLFFPRANALLVWVLLGVAATVEPERRRPRAEKIGQVLIAAALVLLPLRAILWDAAPARGDRSFGLHAPEPGEGGSFWWTSGKKAAIRVPWVDEVMVLKVANGHPRASARSVAVEVLIDGAVVKQELLGEGWRTIRIYLGPPRKETIVLGVEVDRTFRPFSDYRSSDDLEDSRDLRRLGVAFRSPQWEAAPRIRYLRAN